MQVLLHTDPHTDGRQKMAAHLTEAVNNAVGHLRERITRVEAHLSDEKSQARTNADGVHCTLEARLVGLDPVIVKDHAGTAHQAIEGALRKLKRAAGDVIAKHDNHHPHHAQPAVTADALPGSDLPA